MMDAIVLNNLSFKWPKTDHLLLSIDHLQIEKNNSLFLQGESGSGKSTFLSLLSGINLPHSGTIQILGQNLNELNEKQRDKFRADHIGYIFQMFNLIPYLSVIDNVTLPCYFSDKRAKKLGGSERNFASEAKRLLGAVGLSGEDILTMRPTELSLGQQQRIAACRALIGSPEILIADEPTSSLDSSAQLDFLNLIKAECTSKGITLIFVSHDDRLAVNFNQVLRLENGSLNILSSKGN